MDHQWDDHMNETPLQSIPPDPKPSNHDEFFEEVEEDASDGFLDDSNATESDDRSEWGPTETTTSTEPTTSAGAEQDTDATAEVEQAILAEIGVTESRGNRTSGGASSSGKKEPSCAYLHYFTKGDAGYARFVDKYDIPEGVSVTLHPKGTVLNYVPNHINIPLMAITKGGVRFPMNTFIRAVLNTYHLPPDQLSANSYRIINSVYELKLRDNLELQVWDLFEIYAMSRNAKFGRYFLMTRPEKKQIVEHLLHVQAV